MTALVDALLRTEGMSQSFVAVHNGGIVGALVNEAFHDPEVELSPAVAKAFAPLFDSLGVMEERDFRKTGRDKSHFFHQFLIAVDSRYSGCSIAENLITASNRKA